MVGQAERIFPFKQQVIKKLQAQQVATTLDPSPPMVVSSSHIGGDEEGTDSMACAKVGDMVNAPHLNIS